MKKLLSFLIIVAFIAIQAKAQTGTSIIKYSEKVLFINSIPTEPYTVVGKTKYPASKKNDAACAGDVTGLAKVTVAIDDVMERVGKGKQKDFDAVIVYSPAKLELIKFNGGDEATNGKCTVGAKDYVKKCGAKEIYFLCKPIKPFTEVKELEVKNFSNLGQMKMGKNELDNFINKLYEKSAKEAKDGVVFDAIFFNDNEILLKKGYFTPRNIKLIKFN